MKNWLIAIGAIVVVGGLFGACTGSSERNSYSGNYSETYKSDSNYRQNVKDIADEFNMSEEDVDRKINAAVDSANRRNGY